MKKHGASHSSEGTDLETLIDDAKSLLAATGHLTEEGIVEARKRLATALDKGKETWGYVQERAVAGAKAADEVIREHPYHSAGVAFCVGAVLGYVLSRRN